MRTERASLRLDGEYARRLVDRLAAFGQVLAGSETEAAVAEVIRGEFAGLGIPCEVLELPGLVSHPVEAELLVSATDGGAWKAFDCYPFAQSEPAGGLEADLVYLGPGSVADFAARDVRGKVVLVELSYSPPRPEKMRLARAHGAAGMVMVNWGRDTDRAVPRGTVKSVWGNPTRANVAQITTLPAVGVARPDGIELRALAERRGVKVRIRSQVERAWLTLRLPLAWLGAGRDSDRELVLVAGHYDSWGGAVTDNVCGNAAMLTLAKALSGIRDDLRRDVAFAYWPGHESGIMSGSTWFVDTHWDLLRDRCVAYFNIDSIGMRDYRLWTVHAASELQRLVVQQDPRLEMSWSKPEKTGDQSFFGLGIPSLVARSGPTPDTVREQNGAILGWWYHSDQDTLDKLDFETFERDLRRIAGYVTGTAAEPVLPHGLAEVADEVEARVEQLASQFDRIGFEPDQAGLRWTSLVNAGARFAAAARQVETLIDELRDRTSREPAATSLPGVEAANRCLRAIAALTIPVRYSAVDRYDQDTYGLSHLRDVLPVLYPVLDYARATGDERNLTLTEALRARNRVADAFVAATRAIESARPELERALDS